MHKLWFVLLKERNALLTEKYDCESRNVAMVHPERLHKVKLSMKRLKGVLGERKVEYERLQREMSNAEEQTESVSKLVE